MKASVNFRTGIPEEAGEYLVVRKGNSKKYVGIDYWITGTGNLGFYEAPCWINECNEESEVLAWCKMSEIEIED